LVEQLDAWLHRARRANAAEQLHAVCERARLLAGANMLPERDLRALESHCRTAWEVRALVAGRDVAGPDRIPDVQLRADLIDLALLWTDLMRRLAPGDAAVLREMRAILVEADALCGPSAAIARERRVLDGLPPLEGPTAELSYWESAALGRALLHADEFDRAAVELERAVDLRPQDFWAHFYSGVCAYRRGRPDDAIASFGVAVALAPEVPEVYHNRALAYAAEGKTAAARRDYDRALALAPTMAAAALNRGVLHYQEGTAAGCRRGDRSLQPRPRPLCSERHRRRATSPGASPESQSAAL
jgi:tetratricopeptide (TPR) repeat protein